MKRQLTVLASAAILSLSVTAAPEGADAIAQGAKPGRVGMLIHSHNDYAQKRPFWGAYEAGADSIEADVFLVDGELLVAHSRNESKNGLCEGHASVVVYCRDGIDVSLAVSHPLGKVKGGEGKPSSPCWVLDRCWVLIFLRSCDFTSPTRTPFRPRRA